MNCSSGKSENIWDRFVHEHPERIDDRSTGDVACDSYHNWRRDIEMGAELGLDFYRISLSWSRILPSGFPNHINQAGIAYYSNLIDGLLEKGMEPLVTIYHWDLPQSLQDLGRVSLSTHMAWFDPLTPEDEKLAELTRQNFAGRYAHAIYSKIGGWPPTLEKALAEVSLKRGYSRPQLPPFTQEEIEFVRGK
ncbi:hypothetical protein HF086_016375 [Spodoptera exigua]|uniref:Uncharacterized protein n=1 Tax=Spodoptera exigua TaxID=7107 RepID=A0A922MJI6_SPOEX|nr:hypothetical protein HF086_016375 [Spodoptera exigua]